MTAETLVVVEQVKNALGIDADNGEEDIRIDRLIDSASLLLINACFREFHRQVIVADSFDASNTADIVLARNRQGLTRPLPIISVQEVRVDGNVLDPTQYDFNREAGIIKRKFSTFRHPFDLNRVFVSDISGIEVDYTAGYITLGRDATAPDKSVPIDIENGIIQWVMYLYRLEVQTLGFGVQSVNTGGTTVSYDLGQEIPLSIVPMINKYRRRRMVGAIATPL